MLQALRPIKPSKAKRNERKRNKQPSKLLQSLLFKARKK